MASSIRQVALTVLAILLGSCAWAAWARRPSAEPQLSWMDQDRDRDRDRDRPDALDDVSQPTGCFPGNCGPAGGAAGAAYGNDLDMEVDPADPPSAGKRTTSLQEICDNIAADRGVADLLRTAILSCPCDLGSRILQLSDSHYPRHLSVANCLQSSRCRTRSYRMPLLTRRSGSASAQDASLDDAPLVPESLRKHWRFELKSIPVACDCVPT